MREQLFTIVLVQGDLCMQIDTRLLDNHHAAVPSGSFHSLISNNDILHGDK
jgi:hypothetical protein